MDGSALASKANRFEPQRQQSGARNQAAEERVAQPSAGIVSLGRQLRPGSFHGTAERNQRRAGCLTRAALKTKRHHVFEGIVDRHQVIGHRPHGGDTSPR
jgi:hypothetical protein